MFFTVDMTLNITDPKDSTKNRKLLELINTLATYKINTYKAEVFLYTNDKHAEVDLHLSSFTKLNSRRNKEQNIGPRTLTLLEETVGIVLTFAGIGKDTHQTLTAQEIGPAINIWDLMK